MRGMFNFGRNLLHMNVLMNYGITINNLLPVARNPKAANL